MPLLRTCANSHGASQQNQEIWYLLGKVHMKLSEQALANLNAIDPDSVYAHQISGEVMEGMKNFDGAILEYKKAVDLAPQQPGTHYLFGNAYWSIQMWESAAEQFHAELANDPANCNAQWKLGNIVLEQHQDASSEALAQIEKALSVCPGLAQARLDRGRSLMRLERNEEAIPDLQAAEKSDPSEANTHFLSRRLYAPPHSPRPGRKYRTRRSRRSRTAAKTPTGALASARSPSVRSALSCS